MGDLTRATDEELQRIYNDIPSFYDRANALISFFQDVKWRTELVATVRSYVPKPRSVLDVASGKGELSFIVKKLMDKDTIMLDYALNMLKSSFVEGERVLASFYNLPFRDGAFDAVVSSFALHAADDIEEVVREMARVSRGVIGVIAMGKDDNPILRSYVGIYLRFIQPYLAKLVGAKPEDYRYIYYIYRRIPVNSQVKKTFEKYVELKLFEVKALGSVYICVGTKRDLGR
ncbi:class I SAM-dependent methyltransferase [Metallosphaera tengchongensis]|uniref:Class I SAM-dependent methyltransferase n=1 Tax=Metallosphaera tengchongensis TaxID=1532350 RepID=A0A6N0NZB8_9CREN|nr:class I SAM-dependent methyltransferase [Metallosphaera tengchongensis]QKR00708.1 class I SAM-dependent methyltransferase [Metallosphaera tengchongensis]